MINLEWVSEYIDISDQDLEELAKKITKAGINIEKVMTKKIKNVVIGEVLECIDHPDSDHLHICQVTTGNETYQIVCGAPNVRKGLKVIVALPGAILPGNFEIKKSKIRNQESNGMICALFELGLEEKTEENYNRGIEELPSDAPLGKNIFEYLKLDDTLYELDIHKHRNNDCYYHIGFAHEIAAILNRKVTYPEHTTNPIQDSIENHVSLKVETSKCPYCLMKMVTDVQIGESPEFIKRRLNAYGMRSINNVVDISNYVMLEYGQPLHFYDQEKVGNNILIRDAKEEQITTLDGIERITTNNDIVITDGNKPICIAGVMGGLETEVTENTKTLLIESAIFESTSIRYTSNRLNLRSEASIRYGKGLNYEYTKEAIERACYLLEKYANAKVLSGTLTHDHVDKTPKIVTFKEEEVNSLLGITISKEDMEIELNRLDFPYEYKNNEFIVTIPKRRLDIDPYVNDIAEEVGRLYGYHNLKSTLPICSIKKGEYKGDVKYRKIISKRLRTLGLNECKTYTLTSPKMAKLFRYDSKENKELPNQMSVDKSILRTTIIPSLLNVYDYNKARKNKDVFLYEISKTYDINYQEESKIALLIKGNYVQNEWNKIAVKADFFLLKGMIENLLDYMGLKNRYSFEKDTIPNLHPGMSARILLDKKPIGIIGRVHPSLKKDEIYVAELSLNALMINVKPLKFKEANKYPEITKDVAFILDNEIDSETIKKCIIKEGKKILTNCEVFDLYPNIKDGKKSLAYKLTFQDETRTLTEEEVMNVFNEIIKKVTETFRAELRDK